MSPPEEQNGHHHPKEIELPDHPPVLPEIELPDDEPTARPTGLVAVKPELPWTGFREKSNSLGDGAGNRSLNSRPFTNDVLKALTDAGFEIFLFHASGKKG